ncbi:hypothetical protein CLAFUW4_06842 [Fulvia fulva]|uniref:Uncharacterized protein n=1 Tax=Passalora fulva TaxID=5499 RepID=A0A9Q8UR48_PASFU|nr:uncharacterized protein CLAFUR5_06978 [Fulvia fulva]KAK4622181.1 hypothetical protein CLAFUR4_06850 [Fulvia fulva]KAK4622849.1 hypothetical protein CLAFUR0_06845 [Fulvia fulva]UJO19345.1 hypothetical protein CLAFUR5_06978 [Fulvia fulva]WPV15732.1 hypothetical protein CLAFUW4_06842 [Fulvia fulva]WPV30725.1 hypothetical protein CLAFUW7_06841 [Fulvia fulva]
MDDLKINPQETTPLGTHERISAVLCLIIILSTFSMMLNNMWLCNNKTLYKLMTALFTTASVALTLINIIYRDNPRLWTLSKGILTVVGRLLIAWAVSWLARLYLGAGVIVDVLFWYLVKLALLPPQVVEILKRVQAEGQ